MRILVTGGAGYIGSVTVKKLLEQGYAVTVLDSLENGHREAVDARAAFFKIDLRDALKVGGLLSETPFDGVIHFAGYIESGESMSNPLKFFENNFGAGVGFVQQLLAHRINSIIFSSTAGVYGTGNPPFTETSPINTTSYYSMSKYFFEEALRSAARAYGLNAAVLRYFNAAGASRDGSLGEGHHPETHLIPLVIKTALGLRDHFDLYGVDYPTADGTAVRDYIHVEDLAEAHILVLNRLLSAKDLGLFEIYNVGTGQGVSNREVIAAVKKVSGRDFPVVEKPRRVGDWEASFADCTKINKELGWQAKYGLPEIIETAYHWHKAHPQGYGK